MLHLLAGILDCNCQDLHRYIGNCKYDLRKIGRELAVKGVKNLTLPNVCNAIFVCGQKDLSEAFRDMREEKYNRIAFLKSFDKDNELSGGAIKELKILQDEMIELEILYPNNDMTWTVNNNVACFLENKPIYEKFLGIELAKIEAKMGFKFKEV